MVLRANSNLLSCGKAGRYEAPHLKGLPCFAHMAQGTAAYSQIMSTTCVTKSSAAENVNETAAHASSPQRRHAIHVIRNI